ncbi:hypothetical protein D9X30_3777 [Cupriavidus sp. U2]|nr:hypothetical protein D9X30_3777 [Cupriavidus sp. U2]
MWEDCGAAMKLVGTAWVRRECGPAMCQIDDEAQGNPIHLHRAALSGGGVSFS